MKNSKIDKLINKVIRKFKPRSVEEVAAKVAESAEQLSLKDAPASFDIEAYYSRLSKRFCRDCVYCFNYNKSSPDLSKCNKRTTTSFSAIDGSPLSYGREDYCDLSRGYAHMCGKSGKWFKPRYGFPIITAGQ